VCHTASEAAALAAVFTPAWPWPQWRRYRHSWSSLKQLLPDGTPALTLDQAGRWAQTVVGPTTVVLVHSDIHLADSDGTPVRQLWQQMLTQTQPRLVLGVGVGGAGPDLAIGDVVVSRHLRWQDGTISSTARLTGHRLRTAQRLLTPLAEVAPQILADTPRHPLTSTSWSHLLPQLRATTT
jgi:nucleoside phosphorylase